MEDIRLNLRDYSCKVNEKKALINQSKRINGDTCSIVCPRWNGLDLYGRPVCLNSVNREVAGCQDPLTAVMRENMTRRPNFLRDMGRLGTESSVERFAIAQTQNGNPFRRRC